MARSNILLLTAVLVASVVVLRSDNAQAQIWADDFNSYSAGLLTSALWNEGDATDKGTRQLITNGAGYLGGKGLVSSHPGGGASPFSSLGNVWRDATSNATILTARLYVDNSTVDGVNNSSDYSRMAVGFWNSADADGAHDVFDDAVWVYYSASDSSATGEKFFLVGVL